MDLTSSMKVTSSNTLASSSSPAFNNRRGNIKFSSAKHYAATNSRPKKSGLLSFRSTRRCTPRPARVKGIFESMLNGLTNGVQSVKDIAEEMKGQLPNDGQTSFTGTRQHYFMDKEKNIKNLERKVRTLEVQKDRIEELRDEYLLKLKLREGAFNLAQALSNNRPSKTGKEKLMEARLEQKELSEDLCDIEDELETKLGVFKVHINSFTTLPRTTTNSEVIETQLKLSSQKWKARCRIGKHQQQIWQDNNIFLLSKLTDELFIKVVEVKRIQGNILIGSVKCQTREFFSFHPQTVIFTLPGQHNVKLNVDIRWSPLIADDFLSDLSLSPLYCYVGAPPLSAPNRLSNVSRTYIRSSMKERKRSAEDLVERIRVRTESPPNSRCSSSYSRHNTGIDKVRPKSTSDLLSRKVITPDLLEIGGKRGGNDISKGFESSEQMSSPILTQRHQRSSSAGSRVAATILSLGSSQTSETESDTGSDIGVLSLGGAGARATLPNISLSSLVETVLTALEEPKEQYHELKVLESQLIRLQSALKGGRLSKAPSVTLSESNALDSFDFLETSEDDHRRSSVPLAHITEGEQTGSFSDFISLQGPQDTTTNTTTNNDDTVIEKKQKRSRSTTPSFDSSTGGGGEKGGGKDTTGSESIDRILLQHLLHCEYLLQHLQSNGPLNHKLTVGIKKLFREAETIRDLLNYAADVTQMPKLDQMLPELATSDHLLRFWRLVSSKDDPHCISCELFVIALDEKYGQGLWTEFPEIANKVFSELLSRILDLEGDECDPVENRMSVTVFQYASYFLQIGSAKAIPKALKQIAQEMSITEGLRDGDSECRKKIASLLPTYPFNHGALLAAAYLLSDTEQESIDAAVAYLNNFAGNSPWRTKAIQYYIEALEHSDQSVRIGACTALGQLKADSAISQLQYLTKVDFSSVKQAASHALQELGETQSGFTLSLAERPLEEKVKLPFVVDFDSGSKGHRGERLQRTRSAECVLLLDCNEHRTKL